MQYDHFHMYLPTSMPLSAIAVLMQLYRWGVSEIDESTTRLDHFINLTNEEVTEGLRFLLAPDPINRNPPMAVLLRCLEPNAGGQDCTYDAPPVYLPANANDADSVRLTNYGQEVAMRFVELTSPVDKKRTPKQYPRGRRVRQRDVEEILDLSSNYTPAKIAEKTGWSPGTVGRVLSGDIEKRLREDGDWVDIRPNK